MSVQLKYLSIALFALVCAPATLAADSSLDVTAVAGVYKTSFENGNVQGDHYKSEDVLEIVQISPKTAYFRTHLEFFNGHSCSLYGVAESDGASLVFRDPQADYQGRHCVLRIEKTPDNLVFHEGDQNWSCKLSYCGERGSFEGEKFELSKRRTIRYMTRLLASQQYHEAIDAYGTAHRGQPVR